MSDSAPGFSYRSEWHRSLTNKNKRIFTDTQTLIPTCITKSTVELVVNICEELELSPAIEFASIDTLDQYIHCFYKKTMLRYAEILNSDHPQSQVAEISGQTTSTDTRDSQTRADECMAHEFYTFRNTIMIRLVSILMLCEKLVGNSHYKPTKLKVFCGLLFLLCNKTEVSPADLKATEFEVFSTLNFYIKPSEQFEALEMFVSLATNLPAHLQMGTDQLLQLQMCAVQVLRVAYMNRNTIFETYREMYGQLNWESTVLHAVGNKQSIWLPAAAVLSASHLCNCTEGQRGFIAESVMAESSIGFRPLNQLDACIRDIFQNAYDGNNTSDVSNK